MSESLKDGRFRCSACSARAAQGQTYDAVDRREGRPVAIKRFDVRGAKTLEGRRARRARGARPASALDTRSYPGTSTTSRRTASLYLVMEKIEGESLAAIRKRGAVFARGRRLRLLRDATEHLDYLHGRAPPVIHRDLKPGNVIRRPDGSFAFVDFGAVRDKLRPEGGSHGRRDVRLHGARAVPGARHAGVRRVRDRRDGAGDAHRQRARRVAAQGARPRRARCASARVDSGLVDSLEHMLDPDPDRRAQRPSLSPPGGAPSRQRSERGPSSGVWWQDALREGFEERAREYERRARDYETRARQGEPGAAHWGRGADSWRKAADKWRAAAEKHSEKAERRAARHAKRFARKAARHANRLVQRGGRHRHVPPWPILLLFAAAFTAGAIAVTLATQVVVPVVLRFLSVFFARGPLTRAADAVREAGDEALENIQRSQQWFMRQIHGQGGEGGENQTTAGSTVGAPPNVATPVRVEGPEPPRTRVHAPGDESVDDEDDEEEARDEHR